MNNPNAPGMDADSVALFKNRMDDMRKEIDAINRELGRPDLLALADRTRELVRLAKGLLDGNITILFAHVPERVPENLYDHIEYARGHLKRAFADEYDFEAIKRHLYMATALTTYVIHGVEQAVSELERTPV